MLLCILMFWHGNNTNENKVSNLSFCLSLFANTNLQFNTVYTNLNFIAPYCMFSLSFISCLKISSPACINILIILHSQNHHVHTFITTYPNFTSYHIFSYISTQFVQFLSVPTNNFHHIYMNYLLKLYLLHAAESLLSS
jgi:hypothetical protein